MSLAEKLKEYVKWKISLLWQAKIFCILYFGIMYDYSGHLQTVDYDKTQLSALNINFVFMTYNEKVTRIDDVYQLSL